MKKCKAITREWQQFKDSRGRCPVVTFGLDQRSARGLIKETSSSSNKKWMLCTVPGKACS